MAARGWRGEGSGEVEGADGAGCIEGVFDWREVEAWVVADDADHERWAAAGR